MRRYGEQEPIAAFATTPGSSALTLIRLSGAGSIELAAKCFSAPDKLRNASGNTIVHGWITHVSGETPREKIDEVLVSVFRAPKSYTGEDSLDISCHGGYTSGHAVMSALRGAGFQDALPGEFTFRAFMNGKLDLTRSESVMELVSAKTNDARVGALSRLFGALETEINEIKAALVKTLSGIEIYLDYSEDEIGNAEEVFAGSSYEVLSRLKKLSSSWQREKIYREGIFTVIAGRPNAGKSSLFNLLLEEDRSIVTETPGATRDWIEGWISVEGIPVRLADTAGLRESEDPVEKIGITRTRELFKQAQLTLYLIDGSEGVCEQDKSFINELPAGRPVIFIWNKSDIAPMKESPDIPNPISFSAKTGKGLKELHSAIVSSILTGLTKETDVQTAALGSIRQKKLVDNAIAALEESLELAGRNEPAELIAPCLREAINALGEITGEVSTADILEQMFSQFCVGK